MFTLARIMGTSVRMIERHYGALLDGVGADIPEASHDLILSVVTTSSSRRRGRASAVAREARRNR